MAFLNEYSSSWLVKVHQMTINTTKFGHGIQFLLWTLWTIGCVVLSCICVALSDSHAAEGTSHFWPLLLALHDLELLVLSALKPTFELSYPTALI